MEYINAEFETTAVVKNQYPAGDVPEIALVGRSNVGKSSLINCVLNRRKLARTSSTPGKTATINFYRVADRFRFVDLPGYGYAKVSKGEREKWTKMIENYLTGRENLMAVIQLVDARHKPTADDKTMAEWVRRCGYYTYVVATKLDKLKKSEVEKNLTTIYEELNLDDDCILIPFSSEDKRGRDDVIELVEFILSGRKENVE